MGTLTWKKMEPGTVSFGGQLIESTVYELFSLVVPVEYRRSGVARKLCQVALDKAKTDKADIYLGKNENINYTGRIVLPLGHNSFYVFRNEFWADRSPEILRTTRISESPI